MIYLHIYIYTKKKREAGECPLQGHCLDKNNVYQATVVETKTDGTQKVETYVGVSAPPWKGRYRHHNKSFNNPGYKGETILSTHIWEVKARGSSYKVDWKRIDRGTPYTPVTGQCNLCTKEKFYILRKPAQTAGNRRPLSSYCHVPPFKCCESESTIIWTS